MPASRAEWRELRALAALHGGARPIEHMLLALRGLIGDSSPATCWARRALRAFLLPLLQQRWKASRDFEIHRL